MLEIKPHKYNCCDFSQVDSIGVICRGQSLGSIGKYKKHFENTFVAGQHLRSFEIIGKHLKDSNIVRVVGNTFFRMSDDYKDLYNKYNIKDMQTALSLIASERKALKLRKLKNQHKDVLEVHSIPTNMRERNKRFILKRKHTNGKISYPTIGLFSVDLACLYKPKDIHIIGLDFYCANVFVKEDINRSWRKNKSRSDGMIEYFKLLCKEEKDINFHLYTCCKRIKSNGNLRVIRV